MARFLFIHGSCHGAWCWRDVLPHMQGHEVSAIDLPAHGSDATPVAGITLDSYVDTVIRHIGRMGAPVTLVGHSAAGITLAAVAERAPHLLDALVFVCAYVPRNGDSLVSLRKQAKRQPILPAVQLSRDRLSYSVKPDVAPGVFYHDCPKEKIAYALVRLCPEPLKPQTTPLQLGGNYDSVPRRYILCQDDHTIPPEEQERMVADWPESTVTRLPCGHSPFFTMPGRLAALIMSGESGP